MDLNNLLTVSEAIAMAALERKESRGAHFRKTFLLRTKKMAGIILLSGRIQMAK
jgi:aspartate oxidase